MGHCMRGGPITSNGYLNFLREFRKKCCGLSAVETVRQGAKLWNRLSCKQKDKYRLMVSKSKSILIGLKHGIFKILVNLNVGPQCKTKKATLRP